MNKDWQCHNAFFFFGFARQCQSLFKSDILPRRTAETVPYVFDCRVGHLHLGPMPHALKIDLVRPVNIAISELLGSRNSSRLYKKQGQELQELLPYSRKE